MGTILLIVTLSFNGEIRYHTYHNLTLKACLEFQQDFISNTEDQILYSECVNEGEVY